MTTFPGVTLAALDRTPVDEFLELQAQARVVQEMRRRNMEAAIRAALSQK